MAMPSRKNIARIIFLVFFIVFISAIVWYLYPLLRGASETDNPGSLDGGQDTTLFPFGEDQDGKNNKPNQSGNTGSQGESSGGASSGRMPKMRKISGGPVIGAHFANAKNHSGLRGVATSSVADKDVENTFRYVELGTGHVYEGNTISSEITRISNTTIPKINQALFADLDNVLLRYVDNTGRIKTFSAQLVSNFAQSAATTKKLQGVFLPDNLMNMIVSKSGLSVLHLAQEANNQFAVLQSNLLGEEKKRVFSSPIRQWNLSYVGDNNTRAMLTTTPSYDSFGVSYVLDLQTGSSKPYLAARKALGVLPTNDLSRALVAMNTDGETKLFVWVQQSNQYIDLGLSSFIEKCLWAENRARFYCAVPVGTIAEAEPDLWYQGVTQYSDEIWEINAQNGQSRLVASPLSVTQDSLDIVDIKISSDEQFLYFRDKTKRSLWSLQLDYDAMRASQQSTAANTASTSASSSEDIEEFFE